MIRLSDSAPLYYQQNFLQTPDADHLFQYCIDNIPWEQSEILMFGKQVAIPRLNAWYGSASYSYSGKHFEARPLPEPLGMVKTMAERASGLEFNSVLANRYRNGDDCMGWHRDNEKSLGTKPQIASVSLGATRRFLLRQTDNHANKHEIQLTHGSLLLMLGDCQTQWQHSLPRSARTQGERVNLTFRRIVV